mmetsp:Transcript_783/g.1994  ORF Transcript_783/g.1994 Transcript_783/m.1994 type:complete len:230 (+) Transcript_783:1310-1999(+)
MWTCNVGVFNSVYSITILRFGFLACHIQDFLLSMVSHHDDLVPLAHLAAQELDDLLGSRHLRPSECDDDVAGPEAGLLRRRPRHHLRHVHARLEAPGKGRVFPLQDFRRVLRKVHHFYANVRSNHSARREDLMDDEFGGFDGNSEGDAVGAQSLDGVDADHLPPEVYEGPPGIADVNGRVRLDVIGPRARNAELRALPLDAADDAAGHGVLEQQRGAQGDDPLADADLP